MRKWLSDKWYFLRYTTLRGWLVSIRYWWYISNRQRIVVLCILCLLIVSGAFTARHSVVLQEQRKQLNCLAMNIYHEARGEPDAGKYAVAEVTLNRVVSKHYPPTICEVVYQKGWDTIRQRYVSAFSWTELDSDIDTQSKAWRKAMRIAKQCLHNQTTPRVKGALFYHAVHIKPSWARRKKAIARIGKHIFY